MRGMHQGMSEGSQDLQDSEKKWKEGGRSPGQKLLHRLHDVLWCLQTRNDTACTELVRINPLILPWVYPQ